MEDENIDSSLLRSSPLKEVKTYAERRVKLMATIFP